MEKETIFINNEDGTKDEAEVISTFQINEKKYMLISPIKDGESSDDVYAFSYHEEDENTIRLDPIEEGEEWEIVQSHFNSMINEIMEDEESGE